ncbi:MAG: DUF3450 domain-containing protein [Muribaculaceae bacterium]|jgi:septal ring factor EnvC (AmiA/AmiB activator)|uniref:hypothetical protein n=1 Tax=uncultured Duncaniella sp. TaxID=2768039 RepID=UPI00262111CE|nr:hypothetical protein [uncultured Duncaniella sp.]MCI8998493.1 DUF3450 domain-containing protein [Muribaculaceae bacterium]
MAGTLQQRIDKIEAKGALLAERFALLREAKRQADGQIAEMKTTISMLHRNIDDLNRQIEYLKVASVLTPNHHDVEETRAILSELVREIDKCINQLSI